MWTGKRTIQWSILLVSLVLVTCSSKGEPEKKQDEPDTAWWYTIEFKSASTIVHGFDLRAIDENWKLATALDTSLLKGRIPEDDIQRFKQSALSFSLISDVDGDGLSEELFVGVYETNESEKGRFVAITRKGRVLGHFKERGSSGFSALLQADGEIRWYKCMECGEFESIRWRDGAFILE